LNYQKPILFLGFKIGLVPTIIVTLIYESVYFFQAWKLNVKKTEALARENVQSQLETLKNQLDPHFLFNSLNTLASLIEDENKPAQEYLDRLADVYRYVLVSRDKNTVTLEEEMEFLDAYVYLNKTRFRENLQLEKQISALSYQQRVAPLSLQMLIENAIKHNIVSKDKPLKIRISEDNQGYLQIENNVQEKKTFEKSTKVGLQNIINRYKLLTDKQVEVIKNTELFKVRIPLLS
jgi:LytS/YehU family sensor histidine kinase